MGNFRVKAHSASQPMFSLLNHVKPRDILTILNLRGGNMGTGEPSLSSSRPSSISSFVWLWVEVSNPLCFYAFSALSLLAFWFSLVKVPLAFCSLYIWNFELDSPQINTSKEPKGRFGPFSHFRPLSQKRPRQHAIPFYTLYQPIVFNISYAGTLFSWRSTRWRTLLHIVRVPFSSAHWPKNPGPNSCSLVDWVWLPQLKGLFKNQVMHRVCFLQYT